MRVLLVVALLTGCDGVFGLQHVHGPIDGDTGDGFKPFDAPPGQVCFGTNRGFVAPFCYPDTTTFPAVLPTLTFDTTTCPQMMTPPGGATLCIYAVQDISISGYLRATGPNPLVLIATNAIDLTGTIDVSSIRGGTSGAGADQDCAAAVPGTMSGGAAGAGGGAGGSFIGSGGGGGTGNTNVAGGTPAAVITKPTFIRGGCPGSHGGMATSTPPAGASGGGAIYLVAGSAININASILAWGAGGATAGLLDGGAGGGSGGFVGLDAPKILLAGGTSINAKGGGGAEGGSTAGGGSPGTDGGAGGAGSKGGDGGAGAAGDANAGGQGDLVSSGGGGGGGGGGGMIRIFTPDLTKDLNAQVVPAAP